jgi:hypothetical protein
MMSMEEVARIAMDLPEVTEGTGHGYRTWKVAGKGFVWDRPFSKADIKRFAGEPVPGGPILAVRVEDLDEKDLILANAPAGFFTISHFDGYPAVLIELKKAGKRAVREAIVDAWLACAPRPLAEEYLTKPKPKTKTKTG